MTSEQHISDEKKVRLDYLERFYMPEPNSGCWLWLGSMTETGYGTLRVNGKSRGAHRVVYEAERGPIPPGLVLDHLCRNPPCVNPDHLEPVTNKENILRGVGWAAVNARKTHCYRGHEFTPENTFMDRGARLCIVCKRLAARVKQKRKWDKIRAAKRAAMELKP